MQQSQSQALPRTDSINKWETEVAALETKRQPDIDYSNAVIFYGSSTFRKWKNLEREFVAYQVINHGFGGARIKDLIFFAERLLKPWQPKTIILYGGGNDIYKGLSGLEVGEQYRILISKVREFAGTSKIITTTVLPHPAFEDKFQELEMLNHQIKQAGSEVVIDVWNPLMTLPETERKSFFEKDMIHLNESGYVWLEKITEPFLSC